MAYKGKFVPLNPHKYKGDFSNITWRSQWELKFFMFCDTDANVLEWSSEEISIPYISPFDGRRHRYFPDVYMKIRQADGTIAEKLIEIKPHTQTLPPTKQTKVTKRYLNEVVTWGVNSAKWEAARELCRRNQWDFMLITEKELFNAAV